METMTGRERIMTALRNEQPDRVPATPDISTMIPIKLTGKPFWEVEFNHCPSYESAYIDAAKFFGIDGWLFDGGFTFQHKSDISYSSEIVSKSAEKWEARTVIGTPDGDLTYLTVYPWDNSCTITEKPVKDFKEDFKKLRHLFSDAVSCDTTKYWQLREKMGEDGMVCCWIGLPGFQNYVGLMSLEQITYAYNDYPELFEELTAQHERMTIQKLEIAIDAGVDSILTGGSGSITMQSPELWRRLSLPSIKKITRMCKEAGIICGIHSCGKERYMVETCANETDLNYINPLEVPPMGDCDLAECKQKFGDRIALMGNLHTTEVMLFGRVADVRRESLKAILAAGQNGGFVLSTGDQCGRDTPFENMYEMVRVCKEFGTYPLDVDRIQSELKRIGKINGCQSPKATCRGEE
jgi:uroporphyrinogen decarboxylase